MVVVGSAAAAATPGSGARGGSVLGTATGPGKLSPEAIQRVMQRHVGAIRACYEKALAKDPTLEGRVTVRFTIGKDGSVTEVRDVALRMKDPEVVSCVQATVKAMTFPQPQGGSVTTTRTFKFASADVP